MGAYAIGKLQSKHKPEDTQCTQIGWGGEKNMHINECQLSWVPTSLLGFLEFIWGFFVSTSFAWIKVSVKILNVFG